MELNYAEYHAEMVEHYYRAGAFHTVRDPQHDATSGNHHIINATHHLILKKLSKAGLIGDIVLRQESTPSYQFIESTRNPKGWFDRHPTKMGDRQAHDDNVGIITSSKILGLPYAVDLYKYGAKWRKLKMELLGYNFPVILPWYFTNLNDEPKFRANAFHGRFLWMVGLYNVAGNKGPGAIGTLGYVAYLLNDVYFNKDKSDTSGRILKWLSNDVMRGQSRMIDWAIDKWEANIKEMYPNGYMGEVLGIYHGEDHPFSKYMWRKI